MMGMVKNVACDTNILLSLMFVANNIFTFWVSKILELNSNNLTRMVLAAKLYWFHVWRTRNRVIWTVISEKWLSL